MCNFQVLSSGSKGNAYILQSNSSKILIEVGITWSKMQKKTNFTTREIDFALVTHQHADHAGHIKEALKNGIDVYTSRDVINHYNIEGHHRIHEIRHKEIATGNPWSILPLQVPHDVPNLCFLIFYKKEKWLFMTDCVYCPYKFTGLTGISIAVNYDMTTLKENVKNGTIHPALANRILSSHMSLQVALDFFAAQDLSKVREIHVLHTSEVNADKDQIKEAIQRQTGKLALIA